MTSNLPETDVRFVVQHKLGIGLTDVVLVGLSGYQRGEVRVVLFRLHSDAFTGPQDGLMIIHADGTVSPARDDSLALWAECGDWETFAELPEGRKFRLGGETWQKMLLEEVRSLVGGRTFSAA